MDDDADQIILRYFLQAGGMAGGLAAGAVDAAGNQDSGSTAAHVAETVLKNAFGMVPLVRGIMGLFGGGGAPEPAPLVKYQRPSPIAFEAANTASGVTGLDYGQSGLARAVPSVPAVAEASAALPAITIQVQAMDSRSFLDHSSEIAQAVREAMLNMHSLNDVVSEL